MTSWVDTLARRSAPIGRRDLLRRAALAATALMVAPVDFVLRPLSALAAICGSAPSCGDGYTVFCCTINEGLNRCPPGHFVGGWWKADSSAFCCSNGVPTARYYMDCHARCTCTTGCGDGFCDSACVPCSCRCNTGDTCDLRKVCCNNFRYGQCNTHIGCSGPVTCRLVSCTPPYQLYDACGSTSFTDNFTASMSAPCLDGPCT